MQRAFLIVVLAGVLAACSSSTSSEPRPHPAPTSVTAAATPRFDVVLDDRGLTFPPGTTEAGSYRISFEDRRSTPPAGQHPHLQFVVPGPQLLLVDVPAGSATTHVLLANMQAEVVSLDPGYAPAAGTFFRPADRAHRHSIGNVRVTNPPSIETTPQYPTPVT